MTLAVAFEGGSGKLAAMTRACALTPLMPKELVPATDARSAALAATAGARCRGTLALRPQCRRQSDRAAVT